MAFIRAPGSNLHHVEKGEGLRIHPPPSGRRPTGAQMPRADAQKAHIARRYGRRSSHGIQAEPWRIRHSK